MKNFNLRKKILALTLAAITMFSTVTGILPGGVVHAADATSGTYYGINWDMDADGNLTLEGGTCTYTKGTKWSSADVKTVKCEGNIVCNDNFCKELFYYHENLVSADVSGFDTSNVTTMEKMFSICSGLTSLDVSNFNTSNVKNMSYMFSNCSGLTSLNISNFDTSNVTDMYGMFRCCKKLIALDVSNFNTSKVTDMGGMFDDCNSLTALDISNFDTSNVTDMISMFSYCKNLTSLNVSNFNTSNVTRMDHMFKGCENLTSLDLSNFDTSNVIFMELMFYGCKGLTSLDVSSFDTSKVTRMKEMFERCSSLVSLDLSSFDISNANSTVDILTNCNGLEVLTTPKAVGTNEINLSVTMCDDNGNQYIINSQHTTLNSSNTNMTLYLCINGSCYGVPYTYYKNTETVVLHEGVATKTSGNCRFPITTKVVKTDGHVVMNNAFCAYGPFSYIPNAENIDLSNVDTSNVTNMTGMFNGCKKLQSLNISSFDTSKVSTMMQMFSNCESLTTLDLSNFDTKNLTNPQYMFENCSSLVSLDLSSFDMEKVEWSGYLNNMFYGLDSLQVLKTPKTINQTVSQYAQFDYLMHDIVNDVYYETLSVENTTLYNEANCSKTTTTDSIEASYDENNDLVVKAHQTIAYPLGAKITKTIDVDTYGVKDQGTTLLITYDGASTEIEKIVNIEGALLYNDGTPVQQKVVKLSTPKDMFDLSSDQGHYEFLNVSLTNNTMPLSVFDTDNISACSDDILLTSGVVTFDNTGSPVLDNDSSKEMTLVIEKVTPTVPEREEVVVPTPEVVPTSKPSATTTIVVPEPIADNINSVVPDPVVDNTDMVNLPNVVATAPGENTQSDLTKVDDTVNKNILSEKSKQNDEKITDFSKNSDKDNKKIDSNNKKPSEEKDTAANIIKENKSSQKTADMIMGISFLLILIIAAIIAMVLRSKSKKRTINGLKEAL